MATERATAGGERASVSGKKLKGACAVSIRARSRDGLINLYHALLASLITFCAAQIPPQQNCNDRSIQERAASYPLFSGAKPLNRRRIFRLFFYISFGE
jgi:hypothetical protein